MLVLWAAAPQGARCMSGEERVALREEVRALFTHAYEAYKQNAFGI